MCGFVGVVRAVERGPVRVAEMESLAPWLVRRGPDGSHVVAKGEIGIAASRLAIQGGREGDQPLLSADGRFAIAYNGELFASHRRLLRGTLRAEGAGEVRATSDTALLLAWLAHRLASRRAGDAVPLDALLPLEGGMYAFALADFVLREVILHTDGGVKPLYVAPRPERGETWFASTLEPLLAAIPGARAIDFEALASHLVLPGGERPLLAGPAAFQEVGRRVIVLDGRDGARLKRFPGPPHPKGGAAADADDLRDAFADAAREAGETAGPVSVFLSGGLDSAAVAAWCGRKDALAVTGRFLPAGGPFDESAEAAEVARALGLRHEIVDLRDRDLLEDLADVIEALEDPVGGPGSLALHRIVHRARAHGRVALSGTGGDERLAGYARIALALGRSGPWTEGYEGLSVRMDAAGTDPRARWLAAVDRAPDLLPFLSEDFAPLVPVASARRRAFDRLFGDASGADAFPPARALARAEEATTLRMLLRVEDRVTMSLGLESRPVPCLGRFPAVAARVAADDLVGRDGEGKKLLRAALLGSIPDRVRLDRRKRGFPTPFDRAARGDAKDLALGILSDRRFLSRGWWNVPACRGLLEAGPVREAHDRALFSILSLEVWARLFLDGDALGKTPEERA